MRRSIFCVCPPGNTQDSARVWRAIIFGCIPVTFFRQAPLCQVPRLMKDFECCDTKRRFSCIMAFRASVLPAHGIQIIGFTRPCHS